jgi:predicted nucleic acid-binding protein
MKDKAFVDTNLIIYLHSKTEPVKKKKVQDGLKLYSRIISTQVINEYCNWGLQKVKLPANDIARDLEKIIRRFTVVNILIFTKVFIHDIIKAL